MKVIIDTKLLAVLLGTPGPRGLMGLPALLWSPPGWGKTAQTEFVINELPRWKYLSLSPDHDETTYGRVPTADPERKRITTWPCDWFDEVAAADNALIILDDMTASDDAIHAAQLRLLTHNETANIRLPKTVRRIGLANPDPNRKIADRTVNRMIHLEVDRPQAEVASLVMAGFQATMRARELERDIALLGGPAFTEAFRRECETMAGFINAHKVLETRTPWKELGITLEASPRSLELATRAVAACRVMRAERLIQAMLAGTIGSGLAHAYISYAAALDVPTTAQVLDGWRPQRGQSDIAFVVLERLAQGVLEWRAGVTVDPTRTVLPDPPPEVRALLSAIWRVIGCFPESGLPIDLAMPTVSKLHSVGFFAPGGKVTALLKDVML